MAQSGRSCVLVTGGAGYIGSHMVWNLLDRGERVVVLDSLVRGTRRLVPQEVPLIEIDLRDQGAVGTALDEHGVTDILHFAGYVVVPESVADPLSYYDNNTCATRALIAAALSRGIERMIFSSTAAVYGAVGSEPVSEAEPCAPLSPYGMSKLMSETMLRDVAHAHALRHGILRYFNVAGADTKGRTGQCSEGATHLIKVACEASLGRRERLEIYGTDYPTPDGTGVRDYIHVADLVEAHALLLEHLRAGGESVTLNCGYGRGRSVREVVDAVKRVAGTSFEVRETDRRPGDPSAIVADGRALRETLGWQPRFEDLDTIVGHALEWDRRLAQGEIGPDGAG